VCQEILATTYRSTVVKTYELSVYSHLCIYVSIQLPIYTWYIRTDGRRHLRSSWGAPDNDDRVNWEIQFEAVIQQRWRCTWRLRFSELSDAHGGRDPASVQMQLETEIEWIQRYTGRSWSGEFGHALGGWDLVNSEMHLEAVIERIWRCNWRPTLSELQDVLGGHDWASLNMYQEAETEWTTRSP